MTEHLGTNGFFPLLLTLSAFCAAWALQRKYRIALLNPILIAAILVGALLLLLRIPIEDYVSGCAPLQYLLTPATICFAISMYEQISRLRKHIGAILAGTLCGSLTSLVSVQLMCGWFGLDRTLTVSMLPKSITSAIGMDLSAQLGGIASLTTAAIVLTGILGNMFGPTLCRWFRITRDIAQGVAFGTASHAIGTARATELSRTAGAVSSLSLTLAGLITVIVLSFFCR